MNNIEKWLKETKIPYAIIAKDLNVSTKTVYNWIDKLNNNKNLSHRANILLGEYIGEKNQKENTVSEKTQKRIDNQDKLIDLQNEKIEEQKILIESLQTNAYLTHSAQWSKIEDVVFESTVEVKLMPFQRKISRIEGNMKAISSQLSMNHNKFMEYYRIGEWHDFHNHPVNQIIDEKTLRELRSLSQTFPTLFESLKLLIGKHYFKLPIIYKWKKKRCITICSLKVDWLTKPVQIHSKSQIINGDA